MMYWKYLKYVIRHKYYVGIACFKMGLIWQGITHDLSKLLPSEFIPYARYFYGMPKKSYMNIEDRIEIELDFDFAWLLHQKRNRHHWQWWILPEDDGGTKLMPMSRNAIKELIADWIGAGMAISGRKDPLPWYEANKHHMQLNPQTRAEIESKLWVLPREVK